MEPLQQLLIPFNTTQYVTDGFGAYQRLRLYEQHQEDKRNTKKMRFSMMDMLVGYLPYRPWSKTLIIELFTHTIMGNRYRTYFG